MTLAARVSVPVSDLEIRFGERRPFWHEVEQMLQTRKVYKVELSVRLGDGQEQFSFPILVTSVTVTEPLVTFIGTYQGHDLAGYVFYQNQHHGRLHISSKIPRQKR